MRSPAFLAACLITFTSGAAAIASGFYLSEGDILAANYGGSSLLRINQATGEHRSIGTFSGPTDVALSASGDLYVSEWNGLVKRLRLADGETSVLNPNTTMNQVWGLVLGPSGDLYAASRRSNTIVRINPLSGQETIVSRGGLFQDLRGIEWIPPNLVVSSWSDNAVIAVDPLTGAQNDFCQGVKGIQGPWGIAEFNGSLYLGTYDSKILQRYSAGVLVNLASLPGYPIGVATSPAGEIFVGLSGVNAIVRVSPEGVILSTYAGGLIREVSGLQISPMSFVPSVTNTAPRLGSIAEKRAVIGQLLTFSAAASDEDLPVQKLTFSLEPGAPKGASTSPDGTFAWRPAANQTPGTNVITLKVSDDGDPPLADTQTFEVIVDYTNMPPVLAPVPDQIMVAGETVDFVAVADDANIPPQSLTFSLGEGAPAGSSITADGHFTWVTAPTLAGSTNGVVIQVIDDGSPPLISTKAFHVVLHEVALESCTNLCGLFVQHPAVEIYPELREITVPRASGAVFFRLRSMAPVRFEWINRTNDMLRMRYRME